MDPLHYDPAAARASRFGEIVVQGGINQSHPQRLRRRWPAANESFAPAPQAGLRRGPGQRPWSGRRREELEGDSVWVAEGNTGAVVGVLDSAVLDAELVQARGPCLQLIAVAAGERKMIEPGTVLVEFVAGALGMRVQAE